MRWKILAALWAAGSALGVVLAVFGVGFWIRTLVITAGGLAFGWAWPAVARRVQGIRVGWRLARRAKETVDGP